jgi:putative flavoprotein involved in K+ transport
VRYLTDYARHFALPVELDSRVTRLRAGAGGYRVELAGRTVHADHVVVATGPFQRPRVPAIARRLHRRIAAAQRRRPGAGLAPRRPRAGRGGGNTGFQIAEELAGSRDVHLAIGSRQAPLPQRVLGRPVPLPAGRGLMRVMVGSPLGRRMKDREMLIGSSRAPRAGPASRFTRARPGRRARPSASRTAPGSRSTP